MQIPRIKREQQIEMANRAFTGQEVASITSKHDGMLVTIEFASGEIMIIDQPRHIALGLKELPEGMNPDGTQKA